MSTLVATLPTLNNRFSLLAKYPLLTFAEASGRAKFAAEKVLGKRKYSDTFDENSSEKGKEIIDAEDDEVPEPQQKKPRVLEECPICFEEQDEEMFETPCKHKFCYECADAVYKKTDTGYLDRYCPFCRADLPWSAMYSNEIEIEEAQDEYRQNLNALHPPPAQQPILIQDDDDVMLIDPPRDAPVQQDPVPEQQQHFPEFSDDEEESDWSDSDGSDSEGSEENPITL